MQPRRSLQRAALLLACVLVWVLVLAGCTARQSRDQYQERLFEAAMARQLVAVRVNGDQFESDAQYEESITQLRDAARELDSDEPPREVEAAHDAMVSGLQGMADLLERLHECESDSDRERTRCRQAISQEIFDDVRNDFDEANTIYRQEGFSLPGSAAENGDGGDDAAGTEDPMGGDDL